MWACILGLYIYQCWMLKFARILCLIEQKREQFCLNFGQKFDILCNILSKMEPIEWGYMDLMTIVDFNGRECASNWVLLCVQSSLILC